MPKSNKGEAAGSPAVHPFAPIIDEHSKILILGSFPSLKSFENNFYYAHPRNQFWPLLSKIFNLPVDTLDEKRALLKRHHIALWDVVGSCERRNSADSNLKQCQPNDITGLLEKYPNIRVIMFTGKKAHDLFRRYFPEIKIPQVVLPSPSPAYASKSLEDKLKIWKKSLSEYV